MPTIHDSWTGKYNESLVKPFYEATRKARTKRVHVGGDPYKANVTRLSIALRLRLLWPKRPSQRSPFWRPDRRMCMVAETSVRHWTVALKAVQEGHTLIALHNVEFTQSARSSPRVTTDGPTHRPRHLPGRRPQQSPALPGHPRHRLLSDSD
ncbi:hypothetical protein ABZX40_30410 [Streptomyces sp. NPDC004610]|uniref:hypothetical protein n=1 Tax=unclassified Streptomyces TaxID=2593676 RepID=UPI0033B044E9